MSTRLCSITNTLNGTRLTSTIEYADGTEESMDWELFSPDDIFARAAPFGFQEIERCSWWDEKREPTQVEQRFLATPDANYLRVVNDLARIDR